MNNPHNHITLFSNYVSYLESEIRNNEHHRGFPSRLAEAAKVQRSYISRVLKRKCDLSLEQAARIAGYLRLDEDETDYFIGLVEFARAGDEYLKSVISRRLAHLKAKFKDFAKRLASEPVDFKFAQQYYSHWAWMAVHMCLATDKLSDSSAIADRLKLDKDFVERCISDLVKYGFVKKNVDGWIFLEPDLHLPKDSPLTRLNHLNWRQLALEPACLNNPEAIHFTSAFAIGRNDAIDLQNEIRDKVIDWRKSISRSPSEEVFSLCIDWFPVHR